MYSFHVTIHVQPEDAVLSRQKDGASALEVETTGSLTTPDLSAESGQQNSLPFPISFEQAFEAINQLPRMFIELDGSFVWVDGHGSQVDGVLFDRGGSLLYVEIKGSCVEESFNALLRTLGWPETSLMFQDIRKGVYLDEPTFRAVASCSSS